MRFRPSLRAVAAVLLLLQDTPFAVELDSGRAITQMELKRQVTDRSTDTESTKTTLRFEVLPDGPVSQFRLDIPFPDDKQSFSGDPFDPHLGDIKVKVGFRAVSVGRIPVGSYFEVALPTASPESLGSGTYQLTLGVRSTAPWTPWAELQAGLADHRWTIAWLLEQVMSVAGSSSRAAINYTKLELGVLDTLAGGRTVKLTLKPAIDWEQGGKTGSVLEIEGGLPLDDRWRCTLMLGSRIWGEGVKSTYGRRSELTARYRF